MRLVKNTSIWKLWVILLAILGSTSVSAQVEMLAFEQLQDFSSGKYVQATVKLRPAGDNDVTKYHCKIKSPKELRRKALLLRRGPNTWASALLYSNQNRIYTPMLWNDKRYGLLFDYDAEALQKQQNKQVASGVAFGLIGAAVSAATAKPIPVYPYLVDFEKATVQMLTPEYAEQLFSEHPLLLQSFQEHQSEEELIEILKSYSLVTK